MIQRVMDSKYKERVKATILAPCSFVSGITIYRYTSVYINMT